jgi:hypothetical protein
MYAYTVFMYTHMCKLVRKLVYTVTTCTVSSVLLDEIIPKMEQVFKRIVSEGPEAFDIERINNFIDRKHLAKLAKTFLDDIKSSFLQYVRVEFCKNSQHWAGKSSTT